MNVTELDLPQVDIYSDEYTTNLHELTSKLREKSWVIKYNHGFMLLDLESIKYFLKSKDCRTANRDISKLLQFDPNSALVRFNDNFLQAKDSDDHTKMRKIMAPIFTPKEAHNHRPMMRETFHEVLDEFGSSGSCDFVEVAKHYPITVMCRLMGVEASEISKFEAWLAKMGFLTMPTPEKIAMVEDALSNMFEYADRMVDGRRLPQNKKDDLVQQLVDLTFEQSAMSKEDLLVLILHLLAGGYDTSKNQFILMMKILLDHPEQFAILEGDRTKIKPFIEECLRYLNPIGIGNRVTNVDIEYRGITFPKDTMLFMPVTAAGRDPEANENPDTFDIERSPVNHTAWGHGMHFCVGMWLARAVLEEGMDILLDRMKNIKSAGPAIHRPFGAVWGYTSLPISFDPAGRS